MRYFVVSRSTSVLGFGVEFADGICVVRSPDPVEGLEMSVHGNFESVIDFLRATAADTVRWEDGPKVPTVSDESVLFALAAAIA